VPCVFYGPDVLAGLSAPPGVAGSHIDIVATLIDAAAPAGFEYQALGHDLLRPAAPAMGLGRFSLIGPDWVANLRNQPPSFVVTQPGVTPPEADALAAHGRLHALSWWRIMRGPNLPAATPAE
jgi:hypothetical protein